MAKFRIEEGIESNGELILSASQIILSGTLNVASSNSNLDSRYVLTSSFNAFTASLSASSAGVSDINSFTGSLRINPGTNIVITSGSDGIFTISASISALATDVTGSDNFFVKNLLTVSGTINNPGGYLILSSGLGSTVFVSGNLELQRFQNITLNSGSNIRVNSGTISIEARSLSADIGLVVTGSSNKPAVWAIGLNAGNGVPTLLISGSITGNGSTAIIGVGGGTTGNVGISGIGAPTGGGIAGTGGNVGGYGVLGIATGPSQPGVQGFANTASLNVGGVFGRGQSSGSWGVHAQNTFGGYALFVQGKSAANPDVAPILILTQSTDPNTGSFGAITITPSGVIRTFGSGSVGWYNVGNWNPGSLILTSSISDITISGNLKVTGDILNVYLNSLGDFTSSFSASVQSIGDARYTLQSTFVSFTGTINTFTQSINAFTASQQSTNTAQTTLNTALNGFTASFTASVQSIGDARYTKTVNSLLGNITITAGPSITINTAGQDISITGSGADLTALNNFSQSVNVFTASINQFTQSLNGFTASFTASVQSIGDTRYANLTTFNNFVSTTNTLTQSLNVFSATISLFSQSINGFTSSFSSSVQSIGDIRYASLSDFVPYTGTINAFTQSINTFTASQATTNSTQATLNIGLNGFTASFSSSVQSIGDARYANLTTFNNFVTTTNNFTQSVNGFTSSFSASVQSIGDLRYTKTVNSILGNITITAGPAITINTVGQDISITGSGADLSPLNTFSATINTFSQSVNGFTASFTSSVQSIGDIRYTLQSTYGPFSATINSFTQSINGFTSSFSSSVQSIGDARYPSLTNYNTFVGLINPLTQSLNAFTASHNVFSQSVNGFTASFTGSVQSIGDARYTRTINSLLGVITVTAGPNITINTVGQDISITGSSGGDTTALNTFSQSVNLFTASLNSLTQSLNGFTASFTASVQSIGDARYTLLSSYSPFTGSMIAFTASMQSFTAAFSASVQSIGDSRYVTTSSFNVLTGSKKTITAIFDGGGSVLAVGAKAYILEVPYNATITGWRIGSPITGSVVVDVWKETYANWPAAVGNTIAGSEKPTLSNQAKNEDRTLTTWTTGISAGDNLVLNIDSATTVTYVVVNIFISVP